MAEDRRHLQALEEEAAVWLAARPVPADTTAVFDALLKIPYLYDLDVRHQGYVAMTEKTLETALCVGKDGGLPLPLPHSPAECACAEMGAVAVERIHLSGSVREGSDVRILPEEVSDIDVMLQLDPVHVEMVNKFQNSGQEVGADGLSVSRTVKQKENEKASDKASSDSIKPGTDQKVQTVDKQETGRNAKHAPEGVTPKGEIDFGTCEQTGSGATRATNQSTLASISRASLDLCNALAFDELKLCGIASADCSQNKSKIVARVPAFYKGEPDEAGENILAGGDEVHRDVDRPASTGHDRESCQVAQESSACCQTLAIMQYLHEHLEMGQETPTLGKQGGCGSLLESLESDVRKDAVAGNVSFDPGQQLYEITAGTSSSDEEKDGEAVKDMLTSCKQEGSVAGREPFSDESDVENVTPACQHDIDNWFPPCEPTRSPSPANSNGADSPPVDRSSGLTVTMEPAGERGYFLLRHRRLPSCQHPGQLPLSARHVVALVDSVRVATTREEPVVSGPAVSATIRGFLKNSEAIDLVACLRCPEWPCEEFGTRPRPSGWPGAELVARLCRTAAFLVPVGFAGSETEALEWRLSFSRHEYIVLRSMTRMQLICLTALKHCKALVGAAVKPLKSHYLKTALLWLVESRDAALWTLETMYDSMLLILRYLDTCLRHGYLPCYFWPEVNLLANRSATERAELSSAVAALRRRLLPAVLALLADWLGEPVPELAQLLLADGCRLTRYHFWDLTCSRMVRDLTCKSQRKRPLVMLRDLALNGKLARYVDSKHLPLCSALVFGVEASRVFKRNIKGKDKKGCCGLSREVRDVVGVMQPIVKLARHVRRRVKQGDTWMADE